VNTFANFAYGLCKSARQAIPCYDMPLKAGMSIGMLLISIELVLMLFILLFIPRDYAGRALSDSRSANRWARRRCAWPEVSSPKSLISGRT